MPLNMALYVRVVFEAAFEIWLFWEDTEHVIFENLSIQESKLR